MVRLKGFGTKICPRCGFEVPATEDEVREDIQQFVRKQCKIGEGFSEPCVFLYGVYKAETAAHKIKAPSYLRFCSLIRDLLVVPRITIRDGYVQGLRLRNGRG